MEWMGVMNKNSVCTFPQKLIQFMTERTIRVLIEPHFFHRKRIVMGTLQEIMNLFCRTEKIRRRAHNKPSRIDAERTLKRDLAPQKLCDAAAVRGRTDMENRIPRNRRFLVI